MNETPWLVEAAWRQLETLIQPEWAGWEWGAGSSTIWLAQRLARLVSVEHEVGFYRQVKAALEEQGIRNVDLRYCEKGMDYYLDYADQILREPSESLGLILVDGRARPRCISNAIPKLAAGGVLVIDNSERPYYQDAIATIPGEWQRHDHTRSWRTTLWVKP